MERKLIRQGGGGYTIYLPKAWVERKGLKAGERITLIETDTTLVIASAATMDKSITISVTEENRKDLTTLLTHLYRKGYNTITLNDADEDIIDEVGRTTRDLLLGFEVTERTAKSCTIENLSEPTEQKYEALIRRAFFIIKETQQQITSDIKSGYTHARQIAELKLQHDKFVLFCRRLLVREQERRNIATNWELLTFLTHIEHAHYYLYQYAKENRVQPTARILSLFKELKDYFDLYYDAYQKKDIGAVHRINRKKNDLQFGQCYDAIAHARGKEAVVLSLLREIFRLIQIGTSPLLTEILEQK